MAITLHTASLTPTEYKAIKESANWGPVPNNETIAMALARSLHTVVARDGNDAVGMARLIGDGFLNSIYIFRVDTCRGKRKYLRRYVTRSAESDGEGAGLRRDIEKVGYSGIGFSKWDAEAASAQVEAEAPKSFTFMVYMNGSDLEGENGAVTNDSKL